MILSLDLILLVFLVIFAISAIRMKDLLASVILLAGYSLIMAIVWTELNAVDVAFTEAAVGAGITTVLFLSALSRTERREE
jgi:multicomponent Na+:H+ antiporter subunit B